MSDRTFRIRVVSRERTEQGYRRGPRDPSGAEGERLVFAVFRPWCSLIRCFPASPGDATGDVFHVYCF